MIAALLLAVAGPAATDPLSPARAGRMQCYHPDVAARTCRSIASYTPDGAGRYVNTARVLVATAGPVILETSTPVSVRAQAVCGFVRMQDIAAGRLWVAGRALGAEEARPILAQIATAMGPLAQDEFCTTCIPDGDTLRAEATVAGVRRAEADERVRWIAPDEGYRVAP